MTKKRLVIGLVVLVAGIVGFFIYTHTNPRLGFKYYEPSYLPPNISIKAERVAIVGETVSVEQNFRTEDWVYSIHQYKAEGTIGGANQDYDPTSVSPTCSLNTSSNNTRYRVCHWIDYGRIDVQQIKLIKDTTFIDVQIPSDLDNPISLQDIDKFVDSFQQKNTRGFSVLRSRL